MNPMPVLSPKAISLILDESVNRPYDEDMQLQVFRVLAKRFPQWHIDMLNDDVRTRFYDRLVAGKVKNKTVLEVGSGVGLVALMAAKHGAKHVYTCEANPLLYHLAKKNIERSRFKKRVTILPLASQELRLGTHIPQKVDIILSEIIATNIFSERMTPTLRDAERLLAPGGFFLPNRIEIYGVLVELGDNSKLHIRPTLDVFKDIAAFTRRRSYYMHLDREKFRILSDDVLIATLPDGYKDEGLFPASFQMKAKKKSANAYLCLYFKIVDGENRISTFTRDPKSPVLCRCWGQTLWPLDPQAVYNLKFHLVESSEPFITQHLSDERSATPRRRGPT